ncbi:MAG: hypothetical protein IT319_19235 [Anaerolineae bacterium]|nr:hypothetical protein [Anaerolineae bacterium]
MNAGWLQAARQTGSPFQVGFNAERGLIASLKYLGDRFDTDFLLGNGIGSVEIKYRFPGGHWQEAKSVVSDDTREVTSAQPGDLTVVYERDSTKTKGIRAFALREHYWLDGDALDWEITLHNKTDQPLEIGDLGLPLLFNTNYVSDSLTTYTQRVIRHSYIAGHGSFITVMRPNGVGPFLVMTPHAGTKLEYFHHDLTSGAWEGIYTAYVHSGAWAEAETRGVWRQPQTSLILAPAEEATYGFRLRWAPDYAAVRDILYDEGLFDVQVAPGMSVPTDLDVLLSIRTRQRIDALELEHADQTTLDYLGEPEPDRHVYRLRFALLGENRVTLRCGDDLRHYLEFFVTEPVETVIRKRAAFIAANQQIRDSSKWYDGLFSLWDMQAQTLRSPDDTGGLHPYMVGGSDDPTLCKATLIAVKNVSMPDAAEIEAVEYYLERFVWGKLQRTDAEQPHPYGIYGSDNWYVNRNSEIGYDSGGLGQEHMWRTFDYTHMFMLYFAMYQIADYYPALTHYLDKAGYLERAFGTVRAFFVVPYNIKMGERWAFRGWCDWAYKQGNFHELVIPRLIDALEREGRADDAGWLRGEWEKKVKYFVYDHPYPFGSEMFFDTTAFESTHAIARYGLEHDLQPDENLWQDKNSGEWYSHPSVSKADFRAFMDKEIIANIAARGWLETSFYQLGSDIRQHGNSNYLLSYMTQMGGWSIFDYALYYADQPADYLRLGYASLLDSWALVNSGTPETGYGCWFPGAGNDGAAGWGFEPEKYSTPWDGIPQGRGIWSYDGEIDNGFIGAIQAAGAAVIDDPLFGYVAYGAALTIAGDRYEIRLKDGIRQQLHLLHTDPRLHLILDRDGFSAAAPVIAHADLSRIEFDVENRYPAETHTTTLHVDGLAGGEYELSLNGQVQYRFGSDRQLHTLTITGETDSHVVIQRLTG